MWILVSKGLGIIGFGFQFQVYYCLQVQVSEILCLGV